jgi:uncharacterized protein (TIGR00730 family)
MKKICIFCGSHAGRRPAYAEAARALGRTLACRAIDLVYGGGSIGLMGVVAEAALAHGGRVIGVIPEQLARRELMHSGLSELYVVKSMHERKALMSSLADAFIALPGGFGTYEELFEIVTWAQLRIQEKPIALLDVEGYFEALETLVERAVAEGFIAPRYREIFVVARDVDALLAALEERWARKPPPSEIDLRST